MMDKVGLINEFSLTNVTSGANAELGSVSRAAVVVCHGVGGVGTPVDDTVQPPGSNGGITESKFCDKDECGTPIGNVELTLPIKFVPSINLNVAVTVPPHWPVAIKVNAFVTAAVPATSGP